MAKDTSYDPDRLCAVLQADFEAMAPYRKNRVKAVEVYAGSRWGPNGAPEHQPVNLLDLYVRIVLRNLIAKNPRAMLSTFEQQQKAAVSAQQTALNEELERMYFAKTEQRIVLDGLFGLAIGYVGLATPQDAENAAWATEAGMPYAERIDLDDFCYDQRARDFRECSYLAHRIRVPLDSVRDDPMYDKSRKELVAAEARRYNAGGDTRIGNLGRSQTASVDDIQDYVDLWRVYQPRIKKVTTIADNGGVPMLYNREPLLEQKYVGPGCGPYHPLVFGIVPGNAYPKAPIMNMIDLHLSCNGLLRKLLAQAKSQKDILLVQQGSTAAGTAMAAAQDGEVIEVDRPDAARPASLGGPNQLNSQFFEAMRNLFSWLGGNLDIMGGLSPQSKTATQDKMLDQNSSQGIGDMQDTVVEHAAGMLKSILWYHWNHPTKQTTTYEPLPGIEGKHLTRQLVPWNDPRPNVLKRTGNVPTMNIDPYSMRHQTPQQRVQLMDQCVQQIILPMQPFMQQQGLGFNMQFYLKKRAEYLDCPDLVDMVQAQQQPAPEEGGEAEEPGMPAQTDRSYTRRSLGNESALAKKGMMDNVLSKGAATQDRNKLVQNQPA